MVSANIIIRFFENTYKIRPRLHPGRFHFSGAYAKICKFNTVKTRRKFTNCRVTACTHCFQNGLCPLVYRSIAGLRARRNFTYSP